MSDQTDANLRGSVSSLVNPVGDHLGFLLRRCHACVSDNIARELRAYDLRPADFAVLSVVRQNRNIRPSHLGEMLGIKLGNLSLMLDRLQQRGLVVRRRALIDQRATELQLTPMGRTVMSKVTRAVNGHLANTGKLMGETEYAVLISLLQKLYEVLETPSL